MVFTNSLQHPKNWAILTRRSSSTYTTDLAFRFHQPRSGVTSIDCQPRMWIILTYRGGVFLYWKVLPVFIVFEETLDRRQVISMHATQTFKLNHWREALEASRKPLQHLIRGHPKNKLFEKMAWKCSKTLHHGCTIVFSLWVRWASITQRKPTGFPKLPESSGTFCQSLVDKSLAQVYLDLFKEKAPPKLSLSEEKMRQPEKWKSKSIQPLDLLQPPLTVFQKKHCEACHLPTQQAGCQKKTPGAPENIVHGLLWRHILTERSGELTRDDRFGFVLDLLMCWKQSFSEGPWASE